MEEVSKNEKKIFFEKLFNSAVMRIGVKSNTPNERPVRAILKLKTV
jgi:hypothetical protein